VPPRRILLACCVSALALAAAPAAAIPPPLSERIADGVTAAGVDVSGLTTDEAVQRLEGALSERLESGGVIVVVADLQFKFAASDANTDFDSVTTAKRALYAGREALGAPVDVPLAVTHTQRAVERFTARINRRIGRRARDARTIITPRRVRVTHSRGGRGIDHDTLATLIGAALDDPRVERVFRIPVRAIKPKITADEARNRAGTVITIDQSTFTLRLFKRLKVVKTYKVAVGQPAYPTPNGRFAIQSKQIDPVWSVPNSPWAGELAGSTVGGGSIANPLKARWMGVSGSVGIHGTGQDYSIGTRASHGCIRMHVTDVKALYRRVPLGTQVLIAR
jgi:lipoprotein-anchoring transpeptidase ErfK/SrfK